MMKELYLDFKKSIVWRYVIPITLLVNIVLLFDWSITALLTANGSIVVLIFLSYLQAKIESKMLKNKNLIVSPEYRIKEQKYSDGAIYFIPEYYNSNDNHWNPIHRIYSYSTYDDALIALNKYKIDSKVQTRYVTEEKIHNVQ